MIPVTVRLSNTTVDVHITNRLASAPSWRIVVPGGYASATFALQEPIDVNDPMLAAFTRVYIYDGRDGSILFEGRLQLSGRSANDQGEVWALTAIGPSAHTLDQAAPLVYIDTRLEPWQRSNYEGTQQPAGANVSITNHPNTSSFDVVLVQFPSGLPVVNTSRVAALYDVLVGTGMFLGAVGFSWDSGFTSSLWNAQLGTGNGASYLETPFSAVGNTSGGTFTGWVGTDFPVSRDFAGVRLVNTSAGSVTISDDLRWISYANIRVIGRRMNSAGTLLTGSAQLLSSIFVRASWVVGDLLGRMLPQYDGAGWATGATDTIDIDQLAYEDAVTPNQILDDLMQIEPASYWAAWESNALGKYRFEWSNWPTTVRYEASVVDGFDSPAPSFELYNKVQVRYKNTRGVTRTYTATQTITALDNAGIVRMANIDLGDEVGSTTNAAAVAATFLSEHKTPTSGGTLTVARPILDLIGTRSVAPWQIKPGNLIKVRGIEASQDLTGDATRDGITVFRIVSVEVNSDGVATLELDMFTPTEARAIAEVAKKRTRKR
jgi:hypothetical protein